MKRMFIAIPIQETSRNAIIKAVMADEKAKRMPVRWTSVQNLHLTMQFLGDVDEKRIPDLESIIDSVTAPAHPESLVFTGMGAFPNPASPRILWIGIKKIDILLKIQKQLTNSLFERGFDADRKRFSPHLTLGRVKENVRFEPVNYNYLENIVTAAIIPDSPFDRVTLFESLLRPGGPIYRVLYEKKW